MSRCPKLDYESNSYIGNSNDKYICTLCGLRMNVDDPKVEYVCKADNGDKYKDCDIYIKYAR